MGTMLLALAIVTGQPAQTESLTINLSSPSVRVSRSLFGVFFEEINNAGEGGLYGELLMNRGLVPSSEGLPQGWTGTDGVRFDPSIKLNSARAGSIVLPRAASVSNSGFWGVATKLDSPLEARLWLKGTGMVTVSLTNSVGEHSSSIQTIQVGQEWTEHQVTLSPNSDATDLQLTVKSVSGTETHLGYASLKSVEGFRGRKAGLRSDLAHRVDALKPGFLRFPGGCYVEGNNLSNCFDWRSTLVPIEQRPATPRTFWGYVSSNGLGYHEYLQMCEDMNAEPMFVINCGMSHTQIEPMATMNRYVKDALDAIEYANGPISSPMGALRAQNGHPKPFDLKYIEIGNENGYEWAFGGPAPYHERFALINRAIKDRYPDIITISNVPVPEPGDLTSEHYYDSPAWFWRNKDRYDSYDRAGSQVYVGEYAVTRANGRGSLAGALGEAAFMTGMERNADIVAMASYAPLLENINNRQWNPNAIVFDNYRSYGTPSYWVQQMFGENRAQIMVKQTLLASLSEPPRVEGRFGFKTWATACEFKDVAISINGETRYRSAVPAIGDFDGIRGEWSVDGGVLKQSDLRENLFAAIKGVSAQAKDDWVFEFSAKKIEGREGFMALAAFQAQDVGIQWNLGGWTNSVHAFERDRARVGHAVDASIESNRWYRVRLEKLGNELIGSLDGEVVEVLREEGSPNLAASAGVDTEKRELVLKLVNGAESSRTLNLVGMPVMRIWKGQILTADSLSAENTLDNPSHVSPRPWPVRAGNAVALPPRSFVIIRVPLTTAEMGPFVR
ncbi:MAG: hypothetical protein KF812_05110 [Fimbriimonadaceae bacterium]|nr:hypothetical protein [Fimbriimonadaceae bacterium]